MLAGLEIIPGGENYSKRHRECMRFVSAEKSPKSSLLFDPELGAHL